MLKRFASISIIALMLLPMLTACGGKDTSTETANITDSVKTGVSAKTESGGGTEDVHLPQPGEDLATARNNEHLKNIASDLPVKIEIYIDHGGPAETAELTDSESIKEFVGLFSKVTVDKETNETVTDNYNWFAFTFSDGETVSFSLNLKNWEYSVKNNYHIYTLSGFDGLWRYMNDVAEYGEDNA